MDQEPARAFDWRNRLQQIQNEGKSKQEPPTLLEVRRRRSGEKHGNTGGGEGESGNTRLSTMAQVWTVNLMGLFSKLALNEAFKGKF
jgi:hypothetical protein